MQKMTTENLASTLACGSNTIDALITPGLLLDEGKLDRNIQRLADRVSALGAVLRPHLKTAKSIDVARRIFPQGQEPITVSTHAEAGRKVGMVPSAFIELDVDDHRGGIKPSDPALITVADRVKAAGVDLVGALSHAGESYGLSTKEALVAAAENERAATVEAAEILRANGHACPIVSLGSTPTAHFAENLDGVTEVRAGVYMFFDLVQHGVGVCTLDDLAVSVLATVVGAKPEKGWILVDAGWMALSRDRGTASQKVDQGYGIVCDAQGHVLEDVIVSHASQKHGILSLRSGSNKTMPVLPIGSKVRILPNHACAMAAQHEFYSVVNGESPAITARWDRIRGW
jgi:D-serine deaminase-like pyridoxal phosphate-dependent protein